MLRKVAFCIFILTAATSATPLWAQNIGTVDIAADTRTKSIRIGGELSVSTEVTAWFPIAPLIPPNSRWQGRTRCTLK